jgi:multidrug efflux system membrane fusion protein
VVMTLAIQRDQVVVPSQAIQTGQEGQYAYVVRADQTVELRQDTAGRTLDGGTVIEKGIAAGENVVTDGHLRLVPGAHVQVKSAAAEGTAQ